MVSVTTLPHGRALTRDDLQRMPDDGHRYELVDGTLVVTPAPSWQHQRAVTRLSGLLNQRCPADLEVFVAPLDVALAVDTVLQPDVLVVRSGDLGERDLQGVPVLAVEVLSPSTARFDLLLKRSRLEAARCPSYWVVDPARPSLTVWDLQSNEYVQRAHVVGDDAFHARAPFAVSVSPAALVA